MSFVKTIWMYASFGYWTKMDGCYRLATGGWSGNEDIIGVMKENTMFWLLYWRQSQCGGSYVFSKSLHEWINKKTMDEKKGVRW